MANHPVFKPVFCGELETVRTMLANDRTLIEVRDAKNLTPLHVAASRGQHEVVRLLLEFGADIGGPSEGDDWSPIVFAAYRGHVEAVRCLVENGADVGLAGGNPIHFAGQRKHVDVCRLLVENGAIDDLVESTDHDVLRLFRAAYSYDSATVKEVLSRRPELVDSLDKYGRTPLHEACTHGDTKTVRELLRAGANTKIRDNAGHAPADRAAAHRQRGVTKLLLKHENNS